MGDGVSVSPWLVLGFLIGCAVFAIAYVVVLWLDNR